MTFGLESIDDTPLGDFVDDELLYLRLMHCVRRTLRSALCLQCGIEMRRPFAYVGIGRCWSLEQQRNCLKGFDEETKCSKKVRRTTYVAVARMLEPKLLRTLVAIKYVQDIS